MQHTEQLYIDGRWTPSSGDHFLDVISASTEQVIARVPAATPEDVDAAVQAARQAFGGWAAMPTARRAELLHRLHRGLAARADEIARTITGEIGMPLKLSQRIQAGLPIKVMDSFARLVTQLPLEEKVANSLVVREPVGVVGCITPWNYPLHQIVAKVGAALAAGCTVVLKPTEVAPLSAYILAEIIDQSELPPGVFNLVVGTGPVAGEALASHPEVDMITFTGSTRAGKRVSELAAATVKRVALELGGKSAAVVLDDADLAQAVKSTVSNCFLNSGQTCAAHTRLLVPAERYAEAAQLAVSAAKTFTVGDPFSDTTKLGPLTSAIQRERVRNYIRKGLEEGAELLLGGAEPPEGLAKGYYVRPTVFGRVDPKMTIAQEEIFGPVLCLIAYRDEADAIRIANGTPYGLAGGVWGSPERALRVARRLRAGSIDVNGGSFNPEAPFGGYKQSGHGREYGKWGLEEFLEVKAIQF